MEKKVTRSISSAGLARCTRCRRHVKAGATPSASRCPFCERGAPRAIRGAALATSLLAMACGAPETQPEPIEPEPVAETEPAQPDPLAVAETEPAQPDPLAETDPEPEPEPEPEEPDSFEEPVPDMAPAPRYGRAPMRPRPVAPAMPELDEG